MEKESEELAEREAKAVGTPAEAEEKPGHRENLRSPGTGQFGNFTISLLHPPAHRRLRVGVRSGYGDVQTRKGGYSLQFSHHRPGPVQSFFPECDRSDLRIRSRQRCSPADQHLDDDDFRTEGLLPRFLVSPESTLPRGHGPKAASCAASGDIWAPTDVSPWKPPGTTTFKPNIWSIRAM